MSSERTAAGRRGKEPPEGVKARPAERSDGTMLRAARRFEKLVREQPFRYEFRPVSWPPGTKMDEMAPGKLMGSISDIEAVGSCDTCGRRADDLRGREGDNVCGQCDALFTAAHALLKRLGSNMQTLTTPQLMFRTLLTKDGVQRLELRRT